MTADRPPVPRAVVVAADVLWQRVEDEIVVLDMGRQQYHALDDIGARMWEVLDACSDVGAACERLQGEYDVEPGTLAKDLTAFVAQLIDAGLLAPAA
jgi:hypothetical protein